ncbi:copper resistance protein NlpE [Vibrio sp. AK197]
MTLHADSSYTLKQIYQGKDAAATVTQGDINWKSDSNIISLTNLEDAPNRFAITESSVRQLDANGQVIEGSLASAYQLKKQ